MIFLFVQLINDLHILQEQSLLWGCRHKAQGIACRQVVGKREPITHEVFMHSVTFDKHLLTCLHFIVYWFDC